MSGTRESLTYWNRWPTGPGCEGGGKTLDDCAPVAEKAVVHRGPLAPGRDTHRLALPVAATPTHRWELSGSWPEDAPPTLPSGVDSEQLQRVDDGVGPLVHRIYRTRIVGSALTAENLMERLAQDLDCVAPL